MAEVEKLIEIYQQLEDAGLMVIAGKKDSAELMVSRDVVPVVRCKDCEHFEKKWSYHKTTSETVERGYCWHWDYETGMSPNQVDGDDFCSYGERKDDGENQN